MSTHNGIPVGRWDPQMTETAKSTSPTPPFFPTLHCAIPGTAAALDARVGLPTVNPSIFIPAASG